jgi:hypothetical protein
MKNIFKNESENLMVILITTVVIVLTWLTLGWNLETSISGNDSLAYIFPYIDLLKEFSFDWKTHGYAYRLAGGIPLIGMYGECPILNFLCWIIEDHTSVINWYIIIHQVLLTYFSIYILKNILKLLSIDSNLLAPCHLLSFCKSKISNKSIVMLMFLLILITFAFIPLYSWKISYGHFNLYIGMIGLSSLYYLFTQLACKKTSYIGLFLSFITLSSLISFVANAQIIIYLAFFWGIPILISFKYLVRNKSTQEVRYISKYLFIFIVSIILFNLHKIYIFTTFNFSNLIRLNSTSIFTYSYVTGNLEDLLQFFNFGKSLTPITRNKYLLHETNVPLGVIPFYIFFLPHISKKRLMIISILILSFFTVFIFDLKPLSTSIISMFSFLKSFRVPHRLLLPLPWFSTIVFFIVMIRYFRPIVKFRFFDSLIIFVIILILKDIFFDITAFILLLIPILLISIKSLKNYRTNISIFLIIPLIAIIYLKSFKMRLMDFKNSRTSHSSVKELSSNILRKYPKLRNPINRIVKPQINTIFNVNETSLMKLSSLYSYTTVPKRFSKLVNTLSDMNYSETNNFHSNFINNSNYKIYSHLYNLKYQVITQKNSVSFIPIQVNSRWGWSSNTLKIKKNLNEIIEDLNQNKDNLKSFFNKNLLITNKDYSHFLANKKLGKCENFKVTNIKKLEDNTLLFNYKSDSTCLFTLSTNYYSNLRAFIENKKIPTFPSNYSLLGMILPKGNNEVKINSDISSTFMSYLTLSISLMMLIFFIYNTRKNEKNFQ